MLGRLSLLVEVCITAGHLAVGEMLTAVEVQMRSGECGAWLMVGGLAEKIDSLQCEDCRKIPRAGLGMAVDLAKGWSGLDTQLKARLRRHLQH